MNPFDLCLLTIRSRKTLVVFLLGPPGRYLLSYLNSDSGLTRESSAGPALPSVTTSLRQDLYDEEAKETEIAARSTGFLPRPFHLGFSAVPERRDVQLSAEDLLCAPSVPFAVGKQRRSRGTVAICIIKQPLLPIAVYSENSQPPLPPCNHIKGLPCLTRTSNVLFLDCSLASLASSRDPSSSMVRAENWWIHPASSHPRHFYRFGESQKKCSGDSRESRRSPLQRRRVSCDRRAT